MKKYDKEILQNKLDSEEKLLKELEKLFNKVAKDCAAKISALSARTDLENLQSIIYQKQYQEALQAEIEGLLNVLHSDEFKTISEYITTCYQDGFIGAMYALHKQGVPYIFPIEQKAVIQAIQLDSKISEGLYMHLGESVSEMKENIRAEVSRGVAGNKTYNQIAQNIAKGMNTPFTKAMFYAFRIARTEGGRVSNSSAMEACYRARNKGCDVVKQWDSTLDGDTRKSHQQCDGEIRDLDEPFSNGLMFPGDPSGAAAEVINCRCALLQRAKWALDEDELAELKERAAYFGLDKTENFEDFKRKYLQAVEIEDKLEKLKFANNVPLGVQIDLEEKISLIPERHRTMAEKMISAVKMVGEDEESGYKFSTKEILISSTADDPYTIIHEYAHALERAINAYKDEKFIAIRNKGFENITQYDIIYDETTFTQPIYRVTQKKLVSVYQGRLYEDYGIFDGSEVSLEGMREYFSEGYKEYIANPKNLKEHDPELYDYFEGI